VPEPADDGDASMDESGAIGCGRLSRESLELAARARRDRENAAAASRP
jgi:hypothetical protein